MSSSTVLKRGIGGSLAAVIAVFALATSAMAQVEQHSQINFQGTGLFTKETTGDANSHRTSDSGGFLLGYTYQFNRWAGVEGNYGYTRNTNNYLGSFGSSSIQSNFHEITGAFVAHVPTNFAKVRPYALGGAGALVFDPTDKFFVTGASRQTKAAFVYGGGADFDITNHFGVRAEYRGLLFRVPDFTVNALNLDKTTHLAQPSAGFFFRF